MQVLDSNQLSQILNELQSVLTFESKKFWSYVQTKKEKSTTPTIMKFSYEELSTSPEIVNAFAYVLPISGKKPQFSLQLFQNFLISY